LKVIVFGATGMVGAGVLIECLADPRVQSVLVVGRKPSGVTHPKLREMLRSDFFDYRDAAAASRVMTPAFSAWVCRRSGCRRPSIIT